MKIKTILSIISVNLFMYGCAQAAPAPVVAGYQKSNVVTGASPNTNWSFTREVSSKAAGQTSSAALPKEEELQGISPAAGPASNIQVEDITPPAKRSLVDDWTQKSVTTQGTITHTVQPGETVYRLARRYNTTPAEILKQNQMDSTADLAAGRQLVIPSGSKAMAAAPAPVTVAAQPRTVAQATPNLLPPVKQNDVAESKTAEVASIEPAAGPARPEAKKAEPEPPADSVKIVEHKVAPGETVYRIANQYGASVLDVMSANNFDKPQQLKSGMVVKVPVNQPVHTAEAGKTNKPVTREQDETASVTPVPTATAVDEVKAAFNKGKVDPIAARAKGLAWPVHGQLIRRFGAEGKGVAHAGINIAVPPNTPVLATDAGTVLYAGSGLKTYGNLVLVRHENGMVSAYAHNNQLLVSKNETVKKGQVIALSGATGNVDKPQVHFELRRNAGAIDPMTLLAAQ